MPSKPGIYIFKNTRGNILYVGKAKNLPHRVRSYFAPPITLGPKTRALVSQIASLDHIEVSSEVEALLLESRLIKKFRPPYNIASTDDKSPYYIHLTREAYPRPTVTHDPHRAVAGPFLAGSLARRLLKQFRRVAPYCTSPRPVTRACFYSHLGLCHPCPASGNPAGYRKNITRLRRLLTGQFSRVVADLRKDMAALSQNQLYEQAAVVKSNLGALEYLLQVQIGPDEYLVNPNLLADRRAAALASLSSALSPYLHPTGDTGLHLFPRIEFYDNAHLAGDSATSAMVVTTDGDLSPREYRHFSIKSAQTDSDVDMMAEVLTRRLTRADWPRPDLIVLDGGLPQLSAVFHPRGGVAPAAHLGGVPVIALAKREEVIYFSDGAHLKLPSDHPGLLLLMRLRDEAHRFSRRLHHKHRKKLIIDN